MQLNPDDPRAVYLRIAASLRAQIEAGVFKPGDSLPTGEELATTYDVARPTIQHALEELRRDGLIVSRQGGRTRVSSQPERHLGVRPRIERAFNQPHALIDFVGFTAASLRNATTRFGSTSGQ